MTASLQVRPFEDHDLDALAALTADPQTMRFVGDGRPLGRDEAARWIRRSRANVERHGYGTAAVIDRTSGLLVGWTGFARPDDQEEEIIYGLAPDRRGLGLGRELILGLIAYARDNLRLPELRALVDSRNIPSWRLLEGAGFALVDPGHEGEPGLLFYRLTLG